MTTAPPDFVLSSPDGSYHFAMAVGDTALIGRDPAADLHLSDPEVSRRHAVVVARGDGLAVTDQGSRSGTSVDGRRITTTTTVRSDQTIQIGPVALRVLRTAPESPTAVTAAHPPRDKGRLAKIVAVVGVGAAVLSALVGLLVYLQGRPSAAEEFQSSVDLWCAAAKAGQPKVDSAMDSRFRWDPDRLRDLTRAVEAHDKRSLATFRELDPPAELRDAYTRTESSAAAYIQSDIKWMKRVRKLSDRQIRASDPPTLPGARAETTSLGAEFAANLTNLSGGSENCRPTG